MAYEMYPSKSGQGKLNSIGGWPSGNGTKYPGGMPTKKDDTGTVKCHLQKGNGKSPAAEDYEKNPGYGGMFSNLNGLPS